jgi:hypothetical protein
MNVYARLEDDAIFNVKPTVRKLTKEEKRDPSTPVSHKTYFELLQHPAMQDAANRADCYASVYAASMRHAVLSMPANLLEMCRELDRMAANSTTACAAAIRKMRRLSNKWNAARPKRQHKADFDGLFPGEELSFDELFCDESAITTHADFENFFN